MHKKSIGDPTVKISLALQRVCKKLDRELEQIAGQPVALSLFVWTPRRASYISTADRVEVMAVIDAMIAGWKKGMPDIPAHEIKG